MLIHFILISFFHLITSFPSNLTLIPTEIKTFVCNSPNTEFDFSIDTKNLYEEFLQLSFTFSISQDRIEYQEGTEQEVPFNQTFKSNIEYIFNNGQRSPLNYQTNDEGNILNFFVKSMSGNMVFHLTCSDNQNISLNYMRIVFFPANISLKPLEFDTGYQLISVPGYFSGTYSKYETFIIFAIYNLEDANLTINLDKCIGDISLFHLDVEGLAPFLKDSNSQKIHKEISNSNSYILKMFPLLNFIVIYPNTGVIFQWGTPQKALFRLVTKITTNHKNISLPFLKSQKIRFNYNFPEVFLNFSKVVNEQGPPNPNSNKSHIENDTSEGGWDIKKDGVFPKDTVFDNFTKNHNMSDAPIKYKIIIAQSYLFMSIVSKCGLDVFESIPKTGNFESINPYYKEIFPTSNDTVLQTENIQNNKTNTGQNNNSLHNSSNNTNNTNRNNNASDTLNNTTSNSSKKGKNSRNGTDLNESSSENNTHNNGSSQYYNEQLNNESIPENLLANMRPFTLYEHGNNLNLLVNLDTKDYYFINIMAYFGPNNDSYYYYEPILVKDSKFSEEGLVDFGIILIIVGVIIFSLILVFCFYKCTKKYLKSSKRGNKKEKAKKKNKEQQKILFGKNNESVNEKLKQNDRLSQIIGPSDINIEKNL